MGNLCLEQPFLLRNGRAGGETQAGDTQGERITDQSAHGRFIDISPGAGKIEAMPATLEPQGKKHKTSKFRVFHASAFGFLDRIFCCVLFHLGFDRSQQIDV